VWINGERIEDGEIMSHDRGGRPVPLATVDRELAEGEFFLFSTFSEIAFDSRYFGIVNRETINGRAVPLYTRNQNNERTEP